MKIMRGGLLLAICAWMMQFTAAAQFVKTVVVREVETPHREWATQVLYTPDGKEIVTAGLDGKIVFWNVESGKPVREVATGKSILSLSVTGDGKLLAAGGEAGSVMIVDVAQAKVERELNGAGKSKEVINDVAWTADNKFIAAGASGGKIFIWQLVQQATTNLSAREIETGGDVVSLAFIQNADRTNDVAAQLACGVINRRERKGQVEIWDWQRKKRVRVFDEGTPGVRSLSVSPDGRMFAVGNFRGATLLNFAAGEGNEVEISLRALGEAEGSTAVSVKDLTSGKDVAVFQSDLGISAVRFSPDGRLLAVAGDYGVMLYRADDRSFFEAGRIDTARRVGALAFAPDASRIAFVREREPAAKYSTGGIEKLLNPFFVHATTITKEGMSSGVGGFANDNPVSLTGGSQLEVWSVSENNSAMDARLWTIIKTYFEKDKEQSRTQLRQLIKDAPGYGEALRIYGILFENSNPRQAQASIEAAVKADASCAACWRSLGETQFNRDDFAGAVNSFEQVLRLKPNYGLVQGRLAEAYNRLAVTKLNPDDKNLMREARQLLDKALTLRPANAQIYSNLSTLAYFAGDFDASINVLLTAQSLRPDYARIYYNLGHSYRQKGDAKRAVAAYRRYVRLGEEGEEARVERARQYINELSK